MRTGFHQKRMKPNIGTHVLNTKYGNYEYLIMPMKACNAPGAFHSLMIYIFQDCIDAFVMGYIDDLLIISRENDSYYNHFEIMLSRLQQNEFYASTEKM